MSDCITKTCTRCHETKIIQEFHRQTKSPDGYRTICKKCRAEAEGKVYIPYEPPGFKYCRHCQQMLPATAEYYQPITLGKYGLDSRCRKCKNAQWVENYHLDIEASREYARKRYAANPEPSKARGRRNRLEHPEVRRQWYEKNKDTIRIKTIQYQAAHREEKREWERVWAQSHPDTVKAAQHRYRQTENGKLHNRRNAHIRRARIQNAEGAYEIADIRALYDQQGGRCWYCQRPLKDNYHVDHFIPLSKGGSNDIGNLRLACPSCNLSKSDKMPWELGRLI